MYEAQTKSDLGNVLANDQWAGCAHTAPFDQIGYCCKARGISSPVWQSDMEQGYTVYWMTRVGIVTPVYAAVDAVFLPTPLPQ